MPLVNVAPGISLSSERIHSVLACLASATAAHVSIRMDDGESIAVSVERPSDAEALVAEITAKVNGEPTTLDLNEQARKALGEIIADLRETSCAIDHDLDDMRVELYGELLKRMHAIILKYLGGKA